MHEYREEEERRSSPPGPPDERVAASWQQMVDVGDLHYDAAAYSSAADYFTSALEQLEDSAAPRPSWEDNFELRRRLVDCLHEQGLEEDALRVLEDAESRIPAGEANAMARLELRRAQIYAQQGDYAGATELAKNVFRTLGMTEAHREVGKALLVLGKCAFRVGQIAKSQEYYQDALANYRRIGDERAQIQVILNLGVIAKNECRWERALRLFERAEQLCATTGATFERTSLELNRAVLFRKMGRHSHALASAETALRIARTMGDRARLTKLRLLMGQLLIDQSSFQQAEKQLLEARVLAERQGSQRELALADEFLGDLMMARNQLPEAEANYKLAAERASLISASNDILAEVARRRAELAYRRGDFITAIAEAEAGLVIADSCGEDFEKPFMNRICAQSYMALDQPARALEFFELALRGFHGLRSPVEIGTTLHFMARLHLQQGGRDQLLLARARTHEALDLDLESTQFPPCQLHLELSRIELQLGNCDEALLALFEVERLSCSADGAYSGDVDALRSEIEVAMASQARDVSSQVQMLADLPELLGDEEIPVSKGLDSVLAAIAERLGAERAFVWAEQDGRSEVAATLNCESAVANSLGPHAMAALHSDAMQTGLRVYSRTSDDPIWQNYENAAHKPLASAAVFSLGGDLHERAVGIVYLDGDGDDGRGLRLDSESLAMASTYIHLVSGTILAELRRRSRRTAQLSDEPAFQHVLTASALVQQMLRLCSKVACSPYTVLFTGETGVGKGLLAKTVHQLSPRRDEPLISVNCAAIPETLLESELFGHVRGAFTGADRDREGLICQADKGTLFLDEVGKMSLPMQSKLLHFLDMREIRPVGGSHLRHVDVRVICASKRDLEQLVEQGLFLEDLYYRLLDFPIEVPPLRERDDDVLLLAEHYVEKCAAELGRQRPKMTRGFAARLRAYRWPGNVRQLEKVIQRACILAQDDDRLRESHLAPELLRGSAPAGSASEDLRNPAAPLKECVAELEQRVIQKALDRAGWNRSQAARELEISYPTLLQKIRLYDLNPLS